MAKVKLIHDVAGETLTIYFGEPSPNNVCEEAGEGLILIKEESSQKVIGFEKLYFQSEHMSSFFVETQIINGKE